MDISPIVIRSIEIMRNCFGGIEVDILDTEMSRKFPDQETPLGYLGITISISAGFLTKGGQYGIPFEKKHKIFLTYQLAEDIVMYGTKIADSFIFDVLKSDYHQMERKLKLQKINEINEFINDE